MASPRTSVEPRVTEVREEEKKEGLSVTTLVIAALSSATAAIVVSHLWERGTIVASAMTPVVVAIVSDLLRKPVESDVLKSSVRNVPSLSRPRSGRTPKVMRPPDPKPGERRDQGDNGAEAGPVRIYSSGSTKRPRGVGTSPRRRLHLKIAVITGLVAFAIAAAAMTLPELVLGGSVGSGDRKTTIFGGGAKSSGSGESQDGESSDGDAASPTQSQDPSAPPTGKEEAPTGDRPPPDATAPTEPTPTTPSESPTPPAPSEGGTPSP